VRDGRFGRLRAEVLAAGFTSTHSLYEVVHERHTAVSHWMTARPGRTTGRHPTRPISARTRGT
jgi:hypothetical protein